MDSQRSEEKLRKSTPFFILWLFSSVLLSILLSAKPGTAGPSASAFQVTYPDSVHSGEAIKIHVRFSTPPPDRDFYRMMVTIDGQPVAMADISEERSTWITAPGQKEGLHHLTVVWRNPPTGTPETIHKDLSVLPASKSRSHQKTP